MAGKYGKYWYVEMLVATGWYPLTGSVGNASYAKGFYTCYLGFYNRPAIRLVNNEGEVIEHDEERGRAHVS